MIRNRSSIQLPIWLIQVNPPDVEKRSRILALDVLVPFLSSFARGITVEGLSGKVKKKKTSKIVRKTSSRAEKRKTKRWWVHMREGEKEQGKGREVREGKEGGEREERGERGKKGEK